VLACECLLIGINGTSFTDLWTKVLKRISDFDMALVQDEPSMARQSSEDSP